MEHNLATLLKIIGSCEFEVILKVFPYIKIELSRNSLFQAVGGNPSKAFDILDRLQRGVISPYEMKEFLRYRFEICKQFD